jgi:hypothetical protein
MARLSTRRRSGRESQGLVRAVTALSAVVVVAAVVFKSLP